MVQSDHINFLDLALLKVIMEFWAAHQSAPSRDDLYPRLINAWLTEHGAVEAGYANPLTATERFNRAIRQLRRLGYLTVFRFYTPSDTAPALFEHLGDNWRSWPVLIPITLTAEGFPVLDFENATFVLE